MLYAVSEIVFFLLVAALLGGAAGWWLARSGKVSVLAAMNRSGANAAADRELEVARAEIAQLSTKLAIATDAIRELEAEGHVDEPVAASAPDPVEEERAPVRPVEAIPEAPAPPVELRAVAAIDDTDTTNVGDDADVTVSVPMDDEPAPDDFIVQSVRSKGGKRLSDRVAEASGLSRAERAVPSITFDDGEE